MKTNLSKPTEARWLAVDAAPGTRAPRAWPRYMTARVAADYADASPWTIRRHVPPCGRRGRSFIYAIDDVEIWMRGDASRRNEAAPTVSKARVPNTTRARDLAKTDRSGTSIAAKDTDVAA